MRSQNPPAPRLRVGGPHLPAPTVRQLMISATWFPHLSAFSRRRRTHALFAMRAGLSTRCYDHYLLPPRPHSRCISSAKVASSSLPFARTAHSKACQLPSGPGRMLEGRWAWAEEDAKQRLPSSAAQFNCFLSCSLPRMDHLFAGSLQDRNLNFRRFNLNASLYFQFQELFERTSHAKNTLLD